MFKRSNILFIKTFSIVLAFTVLSSCGGDTDEPKDDQQNDQTQENQSKENSLIKIDGKVFSIPSPVQTALLIKEVGANYNGDLLNNPKTATNYPTNFKKAMNVGIYGTDLGYVTIYEQTQDAISYLTAVKTLADELGVSSAFDMELMERFQKNIGNKDSLLMLTSDAYRSADGYLRNNEQNEVGSLILAGGWVEGIYLAVNVANTTNNEDVIRRVGEQKSTIENLIKLLTPYYDKPGYTEFVDKLMDLSNTYEGIDITYTFAEPTTDAANKTTTINSTSEVKITPEQLKEITDKITAIRNDLVS